MIDERANEDEDRLVESYCDLILEILQSRSGLLFSSTLTVLYEVVRERQFLHAVTVWERLPRSLRDCLPRPDIDLQDIGT